MKINKKLGVCFVLFFYTFSVYPMDALKRWASSVNPISKISRAYTNITKTSGIERGVSLAIVASAIFGPSFFGPLAIIPACIPVAVSYMNHMNDEIRQSIVDLSNKLTGVKTELSTTINSQGDKLSHELESSRLKLVQQMIGDKDEVLGSIQQLEKRLFEIINQKHDLTYEELKVIQREFSTKYKILEELKGDIAKVLESQNAEKKELFRTLNDHLSKNITEYTSVIKEITDIKELRNEIKECLQESKSTMSLLAQKVDGQAQKIEEVDEVVNQLLDRSEDESKKREQLQKLLLEEQKKREKEYQEMTAELKSIKSSMAQQQKELQEIKEDTKEIKKDTVSLSQSMSNVSDSVQEMKASQQENTQTLLAAIEANKQSAFSVTSMVRNISSLFTTTLVYPMPKKRGQGVTVSGSDNSTQQGDMVSYFGQQEEIKENKDVFVVCEFPNEYGLEKAIHHFALYTPRPGMLGQKPPIQVEDVANGKLLKVGGQQTNKKVYFNKSTPFYDTRGKFTNNKINQPISSTAFYKTNIYYGLNFSHNSLLLLPWKCH